MGPAVSRPGERVRPRIQPVRGKEDLAPEHHHVVDAALKVFGSIRGPFSILLHSPELAERLLPLVPWFREGTVVDANLRLIGVLAAVREKDSEYVWAAQVRLARELGVREAAIDVLRAKGDPDSLTVEEQEVVAFARQLMRANKVQQAVFDALKNRHGVKWLVEFTAAVNYYAVLCGVANAFDVPAIEGGDRWSAGA
jgi:4-carboxymuconolactone decarboxylase